MKDHINGLERILRAARNAGHVPENATEDAIVEYVATLLAENPPKAAKGKK